METSRSDIHRRALFHLFREHLQYNTRLDNYIENTKSGRNQLARNNERQSGAIRIAVTGTSELLVVNYPISKKTSTGKTYVGQG